MKDEIVKFREVWIIFALLAVIIILLLINKFPIKIEMRENKQVWEANCNCKCEPQEAKPCMNWTIPKSFNINFTQNFGNFSEFDRDKCLSCWDTP